MLSVASTDSASALRGFAPPQIRKKPPRTSISAARSRSYNWGGARTMPMGCGVDEICTVAVAWHRSNEVVIEDHAIDWDRSDYDPYARTKKFASIRRGSCFPTFHALCLARASCWATAAGLKPPILDMVRALCFPAQACRCCLCGPMTASTSCPRITLPMRWCTCTRSHILSTKSTTLLRRNGFADVSPAYRSLAQARGKMPPPFWPGQAGTVQLDGRLAFAPPRQRRIRRVAAEGLSAVFGLEYRVRQHARDR